MTSDRSDLRLQAHAMVVYESMFGSTREVATAIAEGLRTAMSVSLLEVSSAPTTLPSGLDLLVAAGPTHAFGLSRPSTRAAAADQAERPLVSQGWGLREWLAELAPAFSCSAAAVDTRSGPHHLPGSAARGMENRLRHLGYRIVTAPESFWVPNDQGQLIEGERERAHQWGVDLAVLVMRDHPARSWSRPVEEAAR